MMHGGAEEALATARAVATALEAHPALGPSHPDTLKSWRLLAYLLDKTALTRPMVGYAARNEAVKYFADDSESNPRVFHNW
jgi:hypothetical protein